MLIYLLTMLTSGATLRYSSDVSYNDPTAPGFFEARIRAVAQFNCILSADPRKAGPQYAAGSIKLKDEDGALRALFPTLAIAGYGATLEVIDADPGHGTGDYATRTTVGSFIMADPVYDATGVTVAFTDRSLDLAVPLGRTAFAGNNSLPSGTEGTASDVGGQYKPVAYGRVRQIAPPQVNSSRGVDQLHDGQANQILAVRAGGVAWTVGAARTFGNIDNASDPASGVVDYFMGDSTHGAYGRRNSAPTTQQAGPFTYDFEGDARGGSFRSTVADIAAELILSRVASHTNLCLQSQAFDNGSWSKGNATITANAAAAPDGTVTADTFSEDNSTNNHSVGQTAITVVSGAAHTFSIYVRAVNRTKVQLMFIEAGSSAYFFVRFDLTAASVISSGSAGTAVLSTSAITAVGSGWYRCSITGSLGAFTSSDVFVNVLDASGNSNYAGTATAGLNLWGAQLEQASAPTDYIATTAAAVTASIPATSAADVTALNAASSAVVGFWNRDNVTVVDALNAIFPSANARWWLDPTGFRMGQLAAPSGSPVANFRRFDLSKVRTAIDADVLQNWKVLQPDMPFVWKVNVQYQRFWVTQTQGLDANIDKAVLGQLQNEWRNATPASDSTIKGTYKGAVELTVQTTLDVKADADALATALLALYGVRRDYLSVTVQMTPSLYAAVPMLSLVKVFDIMDYGTTGRLMVVLGRSAYDQIAGTATFKVVG